MPSSTRPTRRRPGRPANDRDDRRTRILDAASALFGRHGVAGTSLARIAREAQVTPALVHYYFGDRERLLDALVGERLAPMITTLAQGLAAAGDSPAALAREFVSTLMRTMAANPWLPPLWVREVLSEGGLLRERLVAHVGAPLARGLRDRFAAARGARRLSERLDPRLLVVSLMALAALPFASATIWRPLLGAEDVTADDLIGHTLALLEHGLEAPQ